MTTHREPATTAFEQDAAAAPREEWTTPTMRALAVSSAELGAAGSVDLEGLS